MVTRRNLLGGILTAVVLGASGCAAPDAVQPPTSTTQSPTVTQSPPTQAASPTEVGAEAESLSPPVSRPLTVVGVSACHLLPTSQLTAFGLDPTSAEDHSNAETADCRWFSEGRRFVAALMLSNVRGLESAYFVRESLGYFEPTEISGYPAIRTSSPDESLTCNHMVGIGPNRSVSATATATRRGDDNIDTCALSRNILTAAIANLSAE